MMSNSHVSVRTKNMSTQKMSNLRGSVRTQKTSMQNMSNPRGCSTDDIAMTEVSIKDISKIIEEFKYVPYEGYVKKR